MQVTYGKGYYTEGTKNFQGQIILDENKLFLRDQNEDIVSSYIPVDKIFRVKILSNGIEVSFRPTLYFQYVALLSGERKLLQELAYALVQKRKLKKKFFKREWEAA